MLPRSARAAAPAWLLASVLLSTGAPAASPSLRTEMPPEILSYRDEILSPARYSELAGEWRRYSDAHPKSAVALVMLSRAMRYAGEGTVDARNDLLRKAWETDRACPEALTALAGTALGEGGSLPIDEARSLAERAVELAPGWATPHVDLWTLAAAQGDLAAAAPHARALIDKEGISPPLLDFAYNLLASAERNAIVFTNGDNDTYPPVALQAKHGLRTDVRIVNLSVLNIPEYAEAMLADGPLTKHEIRDIHSGWKDRHAETGHLFAWQLLARVSEKVRDGDATDPVYLAVTVAPGSLEVVPCHLRLEGLLWRVHPEPKRAGDDEDPDVDYEKTRRLLLEDFRLDSATSLGVPWERRSSVAHLMGNYPAVLRLVATEAAARGDLVTFHRAMDRAIGILDFHDDAETAAKLRAYRTEVDPDRTAMRR